VAAIVELHHVSMEIVNCNPGLCIEIKFMRAGMGDAMGTGGAATQ
jgi:hypothetical protein